MNISRIKRLINRLRFFPREIYFTLNGWRFEDLKTHLTHKIVQNDDAIVSAQQITHLLNNGGRKSKIALVTCLPPDETGIAIYSLRIASQFQCEIDIFSAIKDVSYFFRNRIYIKKHTQNMCDVYPINSLMAMNEWLKYDKVVFSIGNSNHNIEIFRMMEKFTGLFGGENVMCYLHDPCCHNIVQISKEFSVNQYGNYLSSIYNNGVAFCDDLTSKAPWLLHAAAVRKGFYGIRAIVDMGVQQFIVNSDAAMKIVYNDTKDMSIKNIVAHKIFHPVFQPEPGVLCHSRPPLQDNEMPRVIGSFGGTSNSKCTDIIINAVSFLRDNGHDIKLILAGYDAKNFITHHFLGKQPDWIIGLEPQLEKDLQIAMASCDLAIQLRKENLGESSGVVPLLIRMGIPTIVSSVGAFREYGEATIQAPENTISCIVNIINEKKYPKKEKMQLYSESFSLDNFERLFLDAVLNKELRASA